MMSPLCFTARVGCRICITEASVMYNASDSPLVLHIANILTDNIVWFLRFEMIVQCRHLLGALSNQTPPFNSYN